jgi:hypothetical protein
MGITKRMIDWLSLGPTYSRIIDNLADFVLYQGAKEASSPGLFEILAYLHPFLIILMIEAKLKGEILIHLNYEY